jgi:diguanylate cyclase (GGDEF)-like protein
MFDDEFAAGLADARSALAAGDIAGAVRFAHSLAGVAPSLGHETLGKVASVIERLAALAGRDAGAGLGDALGDALDALELLFRRAEAAAPEPPRAPSVDLANNAARDDAAAARYKVLVIDDDRVGCALVEQCLRAAGWSVRSVNVAEQALDAVAAEMPDLILLDVVMPGIDGFELCRRIRAAAGMQLVPIIFLTRRDDLAEKVRGFQLGGDDYVTKPFAADELRARVAAHLERLATVRDMAIRDGLTQAYNHKYFKLRLDQELRRSERYDLPLSLALIDVDHFKRINDGFGHPAGDAVLCQLVRLLGAHTRSVDVIARYGGEEFALVLPHTPLDGATLVMSRICGYVSRTAFIIDDNGDTRRLEVTVSVGVTSRAAGDSVALAVARADRALYAAKDAGRNRVVTG